MVVGLESDLSRYKWIGRAEIGNVIFKDF
jgi:hypothetical protein